MNNQNSKKDNSPTINFSSIGGKKPPIEKDELADSMLEEYLREQKKQRVDHPTHYNTNNPTLRVKCKCGEVTEVPIECIDVIRDMPSWKGNAIKYLWRAGLKSDADLSETENTIEDLEKAIWYIKDKIEMIKKGQ
jgi:hypothetical protein